MKFVGLLLMIAFCACGVKGGPRPSPEPPMIGHGSPSFSKASEELKLKTKKIKKIEGDFEDEKDFEEPKT